MPPIDYSKDNVLYGTRRPDLIEALGGSDTVYGRAENDALYGGRGNDRLYGEAGDDLLDGGRGEDRMEGGNGDDRYYVDNVKDQTIEARSTGGTDKVYVSVNWTLGDHFENLRLYRGADIGKGNDLDNILEGNSSDNRLYGRGGSDTLIGNDGDDYLSGGRGNDVIYGGSEDNVWLEFGDSYKPEDDGADVISGGRGSDTVAFRDIEYDAVSGVDFHRAPDTTVDLRDQIVTYVGTRHSDDTLVSIENVSAGSGDDYLYGDDKDNVLDAGSGRNYVHGGDGDDTVIGGFGSDRFTDGDLSERLRGGDGDDIIISNGACVTSDDPRSSYPWARDSLSGGNGDDRLVAGFGFMEMHGGVGADRFEFGNQIEQRYDYGTVVEDRPMQGTISDFSRGEGDTILLEMTEDNSFEFFDGTPTFRGEADDLEVGEIGYSRSGDDTLVKFMLGNTGGYYGDEEVAMTITLEDWAYTLRESDILLA